MSFEYLYSFGRLWGLSKKQNTWLPPSPYDKKARQRASACLIGGITLKKAEKLREKILKAQDLTASQLEIWPCDNSGRRNEENPTHFQIALLKPGFATLTNIWTKASSARKPVDKLPKASSKWGRLIIQTRKIQLELSKLKADLTTCADLSAGLERLLERTIYSSERMERQLMQRNKSARRQFVRLSEDLARLKEKANVFARMKLSSALSSLESLLSESTHPTVSKALAERTQLLSNEIKACIDDEERFLIPDLSRLVLTASKLQSDAVAYRLVLQKEGVLDQLLASGATSAKLSRQEHKNITHSYIVLRKGTQVRVLREQHESALQHAVRGTRTPAMKGKPLGSGCSKTAKKLCSLNPQAEDYVRLFVKAKRVIVPESEKRERFVHHLFQSKPYICTGLYATRKRTGHFIETGAEMRHEYYLPFRKTLKSLLFETTVSKRRRLEWMFEYACALATFHGSGFAHMDQKHANTLVDPKSKRLELADFDLVCDGANSEKLDLHSLGNRVYRAPELSGLFGPIPKELNNIEAFKRANVFSAGLMLLSLLEQASMNPSSDSEASHIRDAGQCRERPFLMQYFQEPRDVLHNMIWEMLSPDPDDRPSMEEVAACLDVHLHGPLPKQKYNSLAHIPNVNATKVLNGKPPGTYLTTAFKSPRVKGFYRLAYVNPDGRVVQELFRPTNNGIVVHGLPYGGIQAYIEKTMTPGDGDCTVAPIGKH